MHIHLHARTRSYTHHNRFMVIAATHSLFLSHTQPHPCIHTHTQTHKPRKRCKSSDPPEQHFSNIPSAPFQSTPPSPPPPSLPRSVAAAKEERA